MSEGALLVHLVVLILIQFISGISSANVLYREGCISSNSSLVSSASANENLPNNYPGTCLAYCIRRNISVTYIVLKETECRCGNLSYSLQTTQSVCNLTCPGHSDHVCGRTTNYSLYIVEANPSVGSDSCLARNCTSGRVAQIIAKDCKTTYKPYCHVPTVFLSNDGKCQSKNIEGGWTESLSQCKLLNGVEDDRYFNMKNTSKLCESCLHYDTWIAGFGMWAPPKNCSNDNVSLENGNFTYPYKDNSGDRETIAYHCDPGYDLHGGNIRYCMADHSWSEQNATCVIKNCSKPTGKLEQGNLTFNYTNSGILVSIEYHCEPGYELLGSNRSYCMANGSWSGQQPNCKKNCSKPTGKLEQGNLTFNYTNSGILVSIEYHCEPGFELLGSNRSYCMANGSWSGQQPNCTKSCSNQTSPPAHGSFIYRYTDSGFLETIEYDCNPGFDLIGYAKRHCLVNGSWSGQQPNCTKPTITTTTTSTTTTTTTTVKTGALIAIILGAIFVVVHGVAPAVICGISFYKKKFKRNPKDDLDNKTVDTKKGLTKNATTAVEMTPVEKFEDNETQEDIHNSKLSGKVSPDNMEDTDDLVNDLNVTNDKNTDVSVERELQANNRGEDGHTSGGDAGTSRPITRVASYVTEQAVQAVTADPLLSHQPQSPVNDQYHSSMLNQKETNPLSTETFRDCAEHSPNISTDTTPMPTKSGVMAACAKDLTNILTTGIDQNKTNIMTPVDSPTVLGNKIDTDTYTPVYAKLSDDTAAFSTYSGEPENRETENNDDQSSGRKQKKKKKKKKKQKSNKSDDDCPATPDPFLNQFKWGPAVTASDIYVSEQRSKAD